MLSARDLAAWCGVVWQAGRTKLFLKHDALAKLRRWKHSTKVTLISARYRMCLTRKRYRNAIGGFKKMQRLVRAWLIKRRYAKLAQQAICRRAPVAFPVEFAIVDARRSHSPSNVRRV